MGSILLGALKELLKLGNLTMEEKHRYEDNVLKLEKKWFKEYEKLETEDGSDNALDDVERELLLTLKALVEATRAKNS